MVFAILLDINIFKLAKASKKNKSGGSGSFLIFKSLTNYTKKQFGALPITNLFIILVTSSSAIAQLAAYFLISFPL